MLLRRLARPMFASWFLAEGVDALRRPAPHAEAARVALDRVLRLVPASVDAPWLDRARTAPASELTPMVRAHGLATALAAGCLATGRAPRAAATALALLTAPLVVAELPDPRERGDKVGARARRQRLLRSVALTGGALLAAADLQGRPGLGWRMEHARSEHAARSRVRARAARRAEVTQKVADTLHV